MATAQVNGSSLTPTPYGSFSQANNDNGTIRANGTVSSNVVESTKVTNTSVGVVGSIVANNGWADPANSSGVFAHNHTKPISSLVTTELAGLSNTAINTPGNDSNPPRSINKTESNQSELLTTAIRANKYNRVSGQWDAGYPSGVTISFSSDDAANPTSSVPGELTYMRGSVTPYNDNYKAKTST